ncbi:MAG: DNA translocase FtsK 4TM domain-containing protein, partial [Rhodospirillales bacterium]|nr:DNA translocase FtsK 4TM domain-containing protein [Rhodospirillales bacterium]
MAQSATKQRPALLPPGLIEAFKCRMVELSGMVLFVAALVLAVALASYAPSDPSLNSAGGGAVQNYAGSVGSYAADMLFQVLGLAAVFLPLIFCAWGWRLIRKKSLGLVWFRLLMLIAGLQLVSVAFAALPPMESWPLRTGLGGTGGDVLLKYANAALAPYAGGFEVALNVTLAAILSSAALLFAIGLHRAEWRTLAGSAQTIVRFLFRRVTSLRIPSARSSIRIEPVFGDTAEGPLIEGPSAKISNRKRLSDPAVEKKMANAAPGRKAKSAQQGSLSLRSSGGFDLPPLDLVEAPPEPVADLTLDKDALANNAKLLETVLEDFGIKGEIVKVRPGPVVTLYELEPAPGIKTSRVIGLADDIARSMSALSVRIAVVPGRTVIGIELPNAKRDMVYFRELLAARAFERASGSLILALGKDIGGAAIMADLARMPHLLIAGTTGSGKSVAVNTMILSLLYQHTPDECKFIMIDPKMLELSVYDGIPNLLSPVVTDPSKAVVALKWAVREMEDRYRVMSQLGVRNIAGYNARLKEARKKGEEITRRVQTGFDDEGRPTYEDQPLNLDPLPLVVVVVDEMADLMMVAGKDIEAAIQRLAQMARAAGIHLIMATQRPSVDV